MDDPLSLDLHQRLIMEQMFEQMEETDLDGETDADGSPVSQEEVERALRRLEQAVDEG